MVLEASLGVDASVLGRSCEARRSSGSDRQSIRTDRTVHTALCLLLTQSVRTQERPPQIQG